MQQFEKKQITKKSQNLSRWYTDVILKAKLADYSPVKGCMVIRPYGYALWENIEEALDKEIKLSGAENAYFPIFIPASFLEKEKDHVEGFSPELAVVTIGGGKRLAENLVVRPTSETIIYSMFSKWISSWRDLPLKINQWCNIVRWEKRTYLFLRTTEFLWQEGHTAHATHKEAQTEVNRALKMYAKIYQDYLAMPGIMGKKSPFDKFPGALDTYAYEMLMPDGKALQGCTSHDLGQNFSKPFSIKFQNSQGKLDYVWQTCWGFTSRAVGGLTLMHGDDNGLVIPPKIAPVKVVIIPVLGKNDKIILEYCQKIKDIILSINNSKFNGKVEIWNKVEQSIGWKINEAELKGIPIATIIGLKEVRGNGVSISTRISYETITDKLKTEQFKLKDLAKAIEDKLFSYHNQLFINNKKFLVENTHQADDYQKFKEIMKTKRGFIKAFWCENRNCEEKIKAETKASTRCLPLDAKKEKGKCIYCGKEAHYRWLFAQAY